MYKKTKRIFDLIFIIFFSPIIIITTFTVGLIIKLTDLKRSAGIGIRLFMPMLGTLGYDIGYGFDDTIFDPGQPHGWEHHFIFGMPIN